MTDVYNPMLEEEDDELAPPANPLQEAEGNPWDKPARSAKEEEKLEERKRAGEAPSGKKKSRTTLTDKDFACLAPLAVLRVMTAGQISMLLATDEAHGNKGGQMASPKTALNRLISLRRIGAVEDVTLWNGLRVWALTDFGRGAAIASGLVGREGQVQKKGLKGLNYATISHTIAVNQVAAQLLSPFGYIRGEGGLTLPKQVTLDMLLTEYQVNNAWLTANARVAADNKAKNLDRKFKDWRTTTLKAMSESLQKGELEFRDVAATEPALWALGNTPAPGDEVREHHLPDLIVNLERFRKGASRGSIAIEVELRAKSVSSYSKQLTLWAAELQKVVGYPDPLLYNKLVYFTNDSEVRENLARADKLQKTGLLESGRLLILPLTERDGKTPLNLSTRI